MHKSTKFLNGEITGEFKNVKVRAGWWWRTPLIPALGRQGQVDLCEFETSLDYKS